MNNLKYSFRVHWSEEDDGFIATSPEFPTLSAVGDSPVEAVREAEVALELLIEAYRDQSLPLPKPITLQAHSGQIRLRMPKELHARAAAAAEEEGVSLNQYLVSATAAAVGAQAELAKPKARKVDLLSRSKHSRSTRGKTDRALP